MRKTLFAGLTVLDEDESVVEDGGAFIGRDRDVIDHYLELGAKTHRHDARLGIPNPNGAPSAAILPSGGTLPADTTYTLGFTLEDGQNGETILSPTVTVSTPPPMDQPEATITAVVDNVAGDLLSDTYYYAISYVDDEGGETPVGPSTPVEIAPGFPNAEVTLSGLTVGLATASAAGWRLYRAVGGGDFGFLASGVADSYVDDGSAAANCDITPIPEDVNSTLSVNRLRVDLPPGTAQGIASATFLNMYLSEDGDFIGDVFLQQFPVSSAGQSILYTELDLADAQPPDVSTSVGGASKIDPDSELLDWHWRRPVNTHGALGSGTYGDVKLVRGTGELWAVLAPGGAAVANDWEQIVGTGGGGSGAIAVSDSLTGGGGFLFDDEFDSFNSADWTFCLGSNPSQVSESGGDLVFTAGGLEIFFNTASSLDDGVYDLSLLTGVSDTDSFGIVLKALDDQNFLLVTREGGGLKLYAVQGGTATELHDYGTHSQTIHAEEWLRVTADGNDISAQLWQGGAPDVGTLLIDGAPFTLTGGEATQFGIGVAGSIGLDVIPNTSFTGWAVHFLRMSADGSTGGTTVDPTTRLVVKGASGVHAIVEDEGDDIALVTLGLDDDSPRTHGTVRSVEEVSHRHLQFGASSLVFAASGSASVGVSDLGGGSAQIMIFASASPGPPGPAGASGAPGTAGASGAPGATGASGAPGTPGTPGAGSSLYLSDDDGPLVGPLSEVFFRASGSATVGVSDLGGGSAQVMIFASASRGPEGPAGASGAPGAAGASGAPGAAGASGAPGATGAAGAGSTLVVAASGEGTGPFNGAGEVLFKASGAMSVHAESLGGNSAEVLFSPMSRGWASASSAGVGSGASGFLDFTASAAGAHFLKLSTNKRSRIRVYGDSAARAADALRTNTVDPSGDHGVLLDYMATPTASGGIYRITPVVDGYNLDTPIADKFYLSVTNYDLTGTVIVAFLFLPTEIV